MSQKNKQPLLLLIIAAVISFSSLSSCNQVDSVEAASSQTKEQTKKPVKSKETTMAIASVKTTADTLTIIGVGDMMLGTNYPSAAHLPKGQDCTPLLSYVKDVLSSGDVTFGNLEGVFLNKGGTVKQCSDPTVCYAFRTPDSFMPCIADAGFDLLSLANNHTSDFGHKGRVNTKKLITENGMKYAGLVDCPTTIYENNGVKYGFCAFAPNSGTCDIRKIKAAQNIVRELSLKTDVVIVSFHGGAEGSRHQHVTRKTEFFYGENRGNVYNFARKMIDAGADVLFGHGPQVTRAIDIYKERFICYSMGNFVTYSRININGVSGIAPIIKVFTDKTGRFLSGEIVPTYQVKGKGPQIDSKKRVIKKIRELTTKDIPEAKLVISDDGIITVTK